MVLGPGDTMRNRTQLPASRSFSVRTEKVRMQERSARPLIHQRFGSAMDEACWGSLGREGSQGRQNTHRMLKKWQGLARRAKGGARVKGLQAWGGLR